MSWKERAFIIVAGLVALGTVGLILAVQPKPPATAPTTAAIAPVHQDQPLVTYLDPAYGEAGANTTIVLYANYACPFCRATESDLKTLVANHPDVRFVWKDLPNQAPGVALAAEAAQCAKAQDAFWDYHQMVLDDSDWSEANLSLHANRLRLNVDAFNACLTGHEMKPLIDRTISEAVALGIDATPTIFIGAKRYAGQLPYAQLEALVR